MSTEFPNWYRLIYHWCVNRHRSGLTIPFLIGVEGGTVENLLSEIESTSVPEKIILKYCTDLNEYVLGLDENENSIVDYLKKFERLSIYDDTLEELGTLEKITSYLTEMYDDEISNETYSKDFFNDIWVPYTEKDQIFIDEALSLEI